MFRGPGSHGLCEIIMKFPNVHIIHSDVCFHFQDLVQFLFVLWSSAHPNCKYNLILREPYRLFHIFSLAWIFWIVLQSKSQWYLAVKLLVFISNHSLVELLLLWYLVGAFSEKITIDSICSRPTFSIFILNKIIMDFVVCFLVNF